ncbi:MAG: NHL repeat-containing protein [Solirubrobacteraceae bacterium]
MWVGRRFLLVVVCWLCGLGCVLACGVPVAQARTVHVLVGVFGSGGSGGGEFDEPWGVAVSDVTHDVYVVDSRNHRVEEWSSSGSTFLGEFAPPVVFSQPTWIAVDNSRDPLDPSDGDVYVADRGHEVVDKFTATGSYVGSLTGSVPKGVSRLFGALEGVAVAPSGEVWVLEGSGEIYNFSDGLVNEYLGERSTIFGTLEFGLAIDNENDLYVRTPKIAKLNSSGQTLIDPFCGEVEVVDGSVGPVKPVSGFGVAVDSASGEVFVDNGGSVGVCGLDGEPLDGFSLGEIESGLSSDVAVDESDGMVYATAKASNEVVVFKAVELPGVTVGAVSEQSPRSLTLNGTVNPEGELVTRCEFEYVAASEYRPGSSAPYTGRVPCSPGSLGSGLSPVDVSAHLTGLTPETKYDYRLVTENSVHIPSASVNYEVTAGPVLGGEFVTKVTSTSAMLGASIDANGDDAHYYIEYGRSVSYGSYLPAPPPGADIGSGTEVQTIGLPLQGLTAGTVYHYRVVVVQDGEDFEEPDQVFVTQGVAGGPVLSDGRAWELVSPADKKGALIEQIADGVGDDIQAANDGSGITYLAVGPAVGDDPQGKVNWSQTLSVRVPGGGWRSEDLTLPRRIPENEENATASALREEYDVFSSDLSFAAVEPLDVGTPLLSGATERTVYLRDNTVEDGNYIPLVTAGNVPPETTFGGATSAERMYFVAGTADLSHVVLKSPFALTEEATFENSYLTLSQTNLYEWSAGRLQLVNILPEEEGGKPTRGPEPQVRLAGGTTGEGFPTEVNPSALSSDGRRVAWTLGIPGSLAGASYKGLYVRDMVEGRTVKVGGSGAVFQWMNSDGSMIFYIENHNLFVLDFETGTRTDLTVDQAVGESDGGVQELVSDVSRDGSYVYFVARGVLAGASGAVSGGDNLYVLHDVGGVWSTSFIATLSPEDEKSWYQEEASLPDLSRISSRVSPDGRYLTFMSDRSLTGYDNVDALSGHADEEVYLYDAVSSRLVCASCDPTGARPVGVFDEQQKPLLVDRGEVWTGRAAVADSWLDGSIPGWDKAFGDGSQYQPRYLSDSGRLFFDSPDTLVPRATNGVEDVYEFEPAGVGDCGAGAASGSTVYVASSGGCVGLISSGISSQESAFFDASENGDDAFFVTAAKLVASDYDNGYDVYDAHVCSSEGVACVSEPVPSPPCSSGDSCKGAPSPQPEIFGAPPSATFSGTGNLTEPKAKPKVKPKTKHKGKRKSVKKTKKKKRSRGARKAQKKRGKGVR